MSSDLAVKWSDKEKALPPPPLLRTHRAPFNAIGSSIYKVHLDEVTGQYNCTDFTIIDGSNHTFLLVGAPAKIEIRRHLLSHFKVVYPSFS